MNVVLITMCAISICVSLSGAAEDDKSQPGVKKKLQIGVKRRIDNCRIKSKKGDFLHMHYTVYINYTFKLVWTIIFLAIFKVYKL